MSQTVANYRWSVDGFLRAWEAGAFDGRVELIEGEVWPVVIGDWHGKTVGRIIRRLPDAGVEVMTSTLPTSGSLPDPDCWVLRSDADPVLQVSRRLSRWDRGDVLLVVEVSDETVLADLNIKARLYGLAGYPVYWVVTEDLIYEHTEPGAVGYAVVRKYGRGERIPVRYASTELAVDDVLVLGEHP